jgi:glycosyltransferase involved in cell wall biosynthesis
MSVIDPDASQENLPEDLGRFRNRWTRVFLRVFYRTVARLSDRIIVPGASIRTVLASAYGINEDRVASVSPGWDLYPALSPKPIQEAPRAIRQIGFHGFIDRTKGLEVLIDAFAGIADEFPEVRLSIIGEPSPQMGPSGSEYVAELNRRAERLGVKDRIEFSGYLTEGRLIEKLSSVDLFVLPYTMLLSRGGSAVLSRVAGLGKPLIASRISRFSDELTDGHDAVLVHPGDALALANAMRSLLRDPALSERLGDQLRRISDERSWVHTAETFERDVYAPLDAAVAVSR